MAMKRWANRTLSLLYDVQRRHCLDDGLPCRTTRRRLVSLLERLRKANISGSRNASTIVSQGVDSVMVGLSHLVRTLAGAMTLGLLFSLMVSNYLFKVLVALLDTIPLTCSLII